MPVALTCAARGCGDPLVRSAYILASLPQILFATVDLIGKYPILKVPHIKKSAVTCKEVAVTCKVVICQKLFLVSGLTSSRSSASIEPSVTFDSEGICFPQKDVKSLQ